ncbi:MAG: T9SS type A sorting domain-containing protein [Bacteroidales bacterium]|nr:T9SS type A sorting domain-containing protein [Bacteroidales bacterium]
MKLYKPTDTGMVLLASRSYSILDTAHWMRLFLTNAYSHSVVMRYMPVFEAYFDEPVIVTDSFYVATTNHYGGDTLRRTVTCIYRHEPIGLYAPCWPQYYKIGTVYGNRLVWQHKYDSYVWFIFPIIDTVQPVCEVPLGLHVNGQDSTGVHLVWDSAEHNRSWAVAYGRANADPESYAELPRATTDFAIAGLVPGVEYAARVRAVCFGDDTYSEWSDTIRFVREGEVGLDSPDDLRVEASIRPNPAHTAAVVTANVAIRSVEAYDMRGHLVLRQKVHGKRVKIVVEDWPKGSYIVHTNTTLGTNIQKIVVK